MVLAAALSLPVTTCPPSKVLERAHPAHPRYYLVSLVRELEVQHLGSYRSPCIYREVVGAAQSMCRKKAVGSNIHTPLGTKPQVVPSTQHVYNHAGQDRAPQPQQESLTGAAQSCCTQQ